MDSFERCKRHQLALEEASRTAAQGLLKFTGTGPMGLVPDEVKATPEYKAAKQAWNLAFKALRDFNQKFTKDFKKELQADRAARLEARTQKT